MLGYNLSQSFQFGSNRGSHSHNHDGDCRYLHNSRITTLVLTASLLHLFEGRLSGRRGADLIPRFDSLPDGTESCSQHVARGGAGASYSICVCMFGSNEHPTAPPPPAL